MKDQNKTKTQLVTELQKMRQRVSNFEQYEIDREQTAGIVKKSEAQLKSLIEFRDESIWSIDKNYRYQFFNDFFKNAYFAAYGVELKHGTHALNILPSKLKKLWKSNYDKAFSGKKEVFEFSEIINNEKHHFMVILNPIYIDKKVTGISAIAINNTANLQAEEALQELSKDQATLLEISKSLTTSLEMKIVLQNIIDRSTRLIGLDTGAIYITKGDGLYLGAASPPIPPDFPEVFRQTLIAEHPNIQKAISTRKPHILPDMYLADLSAAEQAIRDSRNMRSLIYVPLMIKKRAVGVLILGTIKETRSFSRAEIDLYASISNQAALAIENARLFNETQRYVTELEQTILERKKSEDALRKSEEQLRLITDNTTDNIAITTFDLKATYIYVNPSVKTVLGYDPEDLLGKSFFDFIHPDDKKVLFPLLKKYINLKIKKIISGKENTINETIEFRFKNKIGKWRYMQSVVNIAGKQLLAVTRDITERKQAEKALRESEEKLRNIVEHSTNLFYSHTSEHKITYISPQSREFLQCEPEEAMVRWTEFVTDNPINEKGFALTEKAIKSGKRQPPYQLELVGKKGKIIQVEVHEAPVVQNSKTIGIIGSLTDITERKLTEEALIESEERFSAITEQSTEGITVATHEGEYVFVNPAFCEMMGYSRIELMKMTVFDVKKDKGKKGRQGFKNSKSKKDGAIIEVELQRKDKSTFMSEVTGKPIKIGDNDLVLGIIKDITERKQAEEKYRDLVEKAGIAIVIDDLDGNFTYFNNRFTELFGYTDQEIQQKSIRKLVYPEDIAEVMHKHKSRFAGKSVPSRYEFRGVKKDGSVINIESDIVILKEGKLIVGTRSYLWDITDRKQAEKSQQENEEKYRLLVENAHDGIEITQNDRIIFANSCFAEMLGYTTDELKKITFSQFFTNQAIEALKERQKKRESGIPFDHQYETTFQKKNGTIIDVDVKHVIIDYKNKPATFAIIRDITEQKQAEEALKLSEERFRSITEQATDALFIQDFKGNVIEVNKKACDSLGYTREEFLSMTIGDIDDNYNDNNLQKNIMDKLHKGKSVTIESILKRKNGTTYPVEISLGIIELKAKKSILGFARDITERKLAEKELKYSEYKLIEAQKIAKLGHYVFDIKTGYWTNSIELDDIFGIDKKYIRDVAGWLQIVHPDYIETMSNYLQDNVLKQHQKFDMEYKIINIKTKQEKWVHGLGNLEFDDNNNPVEMFGTIQDITKRKQAEERLWESEENYRLLVDNTDTGFVVVDDKGVVIEANEPYLRLVDAERLDDIIGRSVIEWTAPESKEENEAAVTRCAKQGYVKDFETTYLRNDGTRIIILVNAIMHETSEGKRLSAQCRDITERKQAEVALKENEEKYRLIVENAHDGIEITQNDQIIFANSCFAEMLGFTVDELKNVAFSQFFTEQATQDLYERQKKREIGLPFAHQYETTFRKKDGTIINVDIKYEIIEYKERPATFAIIRDITEYKKSEEKKTKLETQLRRAQKLETIGTLAGGIAHDFNNILAPIMGYTDMALLNLEKTHPIYNDLKNVLKGAHRAKDLVEQILLFSKQAEKERKPLALQSLVTEALKLLRPSIPSTIEIRQRMDDSCCKVRADATQIHQVIVNLCTNAWQAMEDKGGTLTLELNQKKIDATTATLHPNLNEVEYACLSIIDTGTGMDEETLDRIFEPFFTTKAVDKGTGLGLSVVHGIVLSHQGDILVYSEPGKGSTFHVYLPILKSEEEIVESKSIEIAKGTEYVMIVDDEPAITEIVKRMLNNFGYKTEVYNTGLDALKAFKRQPDKYDLLISDLTMPQMTGLGLADQLHKEDPEFPIMIMTGFGDKLTAMTQNKYGIKQVIGKPIVIKELAAAVRKVLDR